MHKFWPIFAGKGWQLLKPLSSTADSADSAGHILLLRFAELRICEMYLTKPEVLKEFNPQDLTNTTWGFCKVGFIHKAAMDTLARECYNQRHKFLFGGVSF